MAVHIHTTPSGVNAFGLSGFSLVHGAVPVPPPLLTAETVAMLEAVGHQEHHGKPVALTACRSCNAIFSVKGSPMTSILTNATAMTSLAALNATQKQLNLTQGQIASGLAVAQASDNAAYWSVSTAMRSNVAALTATGDGLSLVGAVASVTTAALQQVLVSLGRMKADIVSASQAGINLKAVQSDIAANQQQILATLRSASFNGVNWLAGAKNVTEYVTAADFYDQITKAQADAGFVGNTEHSTYIEDDIRDASGQAQTGSYFGTTIGTAHSGGPGVLVNDGSRVVQDVPYGTDGTTTYVSSYGTGEILSSVDTSSMSLLSQDTGSYTYDYTKHFTDQDIHTVSTSSSTYTSGLLGAAIAGFTEPDGTTASILTFDLGSVDAGDLYTLASAVETAITAVSGVATKVAAVSTTVANLQSFDTALGDALTSGVGSLIDADMNVASTRLQALQTQQQLGIQALSIANGNSQLILKLFGGS